MFPSPLKIESSHETFRKTKNEEAIFINLLWKTFESSYTAQNM